MTFEKVFKKPSEGLQEGLDFLRKTLQRPLQRIYDEIPSRRPSEGLLKGGPKSPATNIFYKAFPWPYPRKCTGKVLLKGLQKALLKALPTINEDMLESRIEGLPKAFRRNVYFVKTTYAGKPFFRISFFCHVSKL